MSATPKPNLTLMIANTNYVFAAKMHPYSAGGAYVNMMMDEGQERVKVSNRDNYPRLARVKAKYDPQKTCSG